MNNIIFPFFFNDRISSSPGWPPTHFVGKNILEFLVFLPPALQWGIISMQHYTW